MTSRIVRTICILSLIIIIATLIRLCTCKQGEREVFTTKTAIDVKEINTLAQQRSVAEQITQLKGPNGETFPTEQDPISKIYGVNDYGKGNIIKTPYGLKLCTYNNKKGCIASCILRDELICSPLCKSQCYSNGEGLPANYSLTKGANLINSNKTWNRDKSSPSPHAANTEHFYI